VWDLESQQLSQGVPVASCEPCWKQEKQGMLSFRQLHPDRMSNDIELYLSNLCNHMCSYCSPKFSSVWEDNISSQGMFENISASAKNNLKIIDHNQIDLEYWFQEVSQYIVSQPKNSVNLKLLGGEPLMQFTNLQKVIEVGSDNINQLRIHTNLNPPNNKFLTWLLENVPVEKLRFIISIDATPEYNHIPRSGFDREQFLINLELLKQHQVQFTLLSVFNVLSIFDLANFVRWAKPYTLDFSRLSGVDCLQPNLLPSSIIEQICQNFNNQPWPKLLQELYENRKEPLDLKLFEQYNYLKEYFDRTKIVPESIDNAVFQQYWTLVSKKF
jgi:sulfatase maturation enzyme AslB (radical SAM superfamily)